MTEDRAIVVVAANQKMTRTMIEALKRHRDNPPLFPTPDTLSVESLERMIDELTTGRARLVIASDYTWRRLNVVVTNADPS